ncbi:cytochrome c oxidase assembly protein [Cereibacter sphaeroides]|uniref:cytochrome c oxidase assembly protein n=1 Tax=Cereibacter sphaeroides TaxID=1063 RepID=UPI001F25A52D|nr:cytochrome c oxidase assembly protein [Cereibacter sphaeroides]MCE6960853.1 cytochrome c oxidase assembly protein [Cereibacter sphaeroides]MCE6969881.1 cytochrome c oxidase assembly protein [Cereibacter sphaeroides]MCE6974269.1 cytochrome c oxidase assembly protein [Cereibacter sphaeroides]
MLEALSGIYCGPPPEPADVWGRWNLDPLLLAAMAGLTLAVGRSRAGLAAVAVLAVVFVSPLCALSSAFFAARSVHHILLVAVAAPLLAAAIPARGMGAAAPWLAISTAVLWFWHLPPAYDAALSNMAGYWIMPATLILSACLFWRAVLSGRTQLVGRFLMVTAAYLQMALLGAVLTFVPLPLYEIHQAAPAGWALQPLADQQLGGLIMWVPGALPYALAAAFIARQAWPVARGTRA